MKINSVTAVYPSYKNIVSSWRTHFWQIVVKIETDKGLVGYGYGGGGLAAVEVVNKHFSEILCGKEINDTQDISVLWDDLYQQCLPYGRKGIAIMALSGVDLALWDLVAKSEHVPVYRLVGIRSKQQVRTYATGTDIEWYGESGFTAHKFPHRWMDESDYQKAVNSAEIARSILGKKALVMIDTYMSWNGDVTLEMTKILSPYNIYWFEDVLTPDDLLGQANIRSEVKPTLLAGGEHEFTHHGFMEIARSAALDIWQPDITWCGGITAALRIIEIADKFGIPVIPHRGGEVWGLHLIVSSGCQDLAEVLPGMKGGPKDQLWEGEPQSEQGYIEPNDRPGFGVTINESLLN